MNVSTVKLIIEIFDKIQKREEKIISALDIIDPDCFHSFSDLNGVFSDLMEIFLPEKISQELDYYLYECKLGRTKEGKVTIDGKEWILDSDDAFIQYLLDNNLIHNDN